MSSLIWSAAQDAISARPGLEAVAQRLVPRTAGEFWTLIGVMVEAGVPLRIVQPDWVAIEDGQERPLTDVEEAAVEAGQDQNGPAAGTLSIEYEDEDPDAE